MRRLPMTAPLAPARIVSLVDLMLRAVTDEATTSSVRLLEAAPWLGAGLGGAERSLANQLLVVPRLTVNPGRQSLETARGVLALVVTRGLIAARVHVGTGSGAAILGPGELISPSDFSAGDSALGERRELVALAPSELVALDRRLWVAAARWPSIGEAFLECLTERVRMASVSVALHQRQRVDERIWLAMWHLADRHGKVGPRGVFVELPKLTHQLLSEIVAARRPSVTCALRRLTTLGLLARVGRTGWLLTADPEEGLAAIDSGRTIARVESAPVNSSGAHAVADRTFAAFA